MKPSTAAIVSVFLLSSVCATPCNAQGFFQDYFSSNTYSPSDPWIKGRIFRTHTGHDGLYYNCDEEESKRNSPYIYWKSQGCRENIHTWKFVKKETRQTINDPICRWKRGSCQTCPPAVNYPPGAGYGTLASEKKANTNSQEIKQVHDNNLPEVSNLIEETSAPALPKTTTENSTRSSNPAPAAEPNQIQAPNNKKRNPSAAEEAVPLLKPLIDKKTSGLFPQNFIQGRNPNPPVSGIIGKWSPKVQQNQIQKTAARPVRSRGYGTLHRNGAEFTEPPQVIR